MSELTPAAPLGTSLESLKGLKGNEYRKAWNKLHKESGRKAKKAWRLRNPEKCKMDEATKKELSRRYRESGKRKIDRQLYNPIYYGGWDKASMRHQPWGIVEECVVMDRSIRDSEIAVKLGRSIRAIQIRRCHLKKQNLDQLNNDSRH